MNSRHLIALAISGLTACLIAFYWTHYQSAAKRAPNTVDIIDTTSTQTTPSMAKPGKSGTELSPIQLGLRAAIIEQRAASEQLRQAELALTELEEFVSDLERRGEDPADYADEGLEKFRPAYLDFETAQTRLDQAESIIAELSLQLSQSELEAVQQSDSDEPLE